MRVLAILLLLTACKATPDELAAARCDPTVDLEDCDAAGLRRLVCNATNGQWTPLALCQAPEVCAQLAPDANGMRKSHCQVPSSAGDDATVGDSSPPSDADVTVADAKPTDAKSDAKTDAATPDVAKVDVPDSALDVPDVPQTGLIPAQACFQKQCAMATYTCLQSSVCIAAITAAFACVDACGGGQGCIVQCQSNWSGDASAFALATCGMLKCGGGCGNGVCGPNETPTTCPGDCKALTGSCVGHCGGASTDCFCDGVCKNNSDCCNDYYAVCGG